MSQQEARRALGEPGDGLFRIRRGFPASVGAIFLLIQLAACIAVLVLSKEEKPHVPLRAFIIGQSIICTFSLILLLLDYLSPRIFEEIDNQLIFQGINGCIQATVGVLTLAWYIAGSVWVSKASSTSSDTPILFWTSLGFIIFAAGGIAVTAISLLTSCCCLSCILCCSS